MQQEHSNQGLQIQQLSENSMKEEIFLLHLNMTQKETR
jgi:hypothetical protein